MDYPTYEDVLKAQPVVGWYLPRTPTYSYPGLSAFVGCELFVKHENHLPIGAFKVRGGVNFMASLAEAERKRGVITATRGNHGQSIAYAARLFDAKAVVVVPRGNNPEKNAAMSALGAEVIEHGKDFDEARIRGHAGGDAWLSLLTSGERAPLDRRRGDVCAGIVR